MNKIITSALTHLIKSEEDLLESSRRELNSQEIMDWESEINSIKTTLKLVRENIERKKSINIIKKIKKIA